MSLYQLFEFLVTQQFKQRLENDFVQNSQHCKCQDINQSYFRKLLQASTISMKKNFSKTAHTVFTVRSIFIYVLRLNCYHFRIALTKSLKLHFLRIALQHLKTIQDSYSVGIPIRSYSTINIFKNYVLFPMFFRKTLKKKH